MTRISNPLLWLLVSVLAARLGLSALLPFADTTEPRYAEMARIMAENGDWITPWFDIGVPFWVTRLIVKGVSKPNRLGDPNNKPIQANGAKYYLSC